MRILQRIRDAQNIGMIKAGDYQIQYDYDLEGKIIKETTTGDINRTVAYEYDVTDNIVKETYTDAQNIIVKVYTYDESSNITGVSITSTAVVA